jgi:hypothetical protein
LFASEIPFKKGTNNLIILEASIQNIHITERIKEA